MTEHEIRKTEIKQAVKEALQESNLVDGPTHIRHHQVLEEFLNMVVHAKKTIIGTLAKVGVTIFFLGLFVWFAFHRN